MSAGKLLEAQPGPVGREGAGGGERVWERGLGKRGLKKEAWEKRGLGKRGFEKRRFGGKRESAGRKLNGGRELLSHNGN